MNKLEGIGLLPKLGDLESLFIHNEVKRKKHLNLFQVLSHKQGWDWKKKKNHTGGENLYHNL